MRWNNSTKVAPAPDFIEPCLPTVAPQAPAGEVWVFEVKWDGYRLLVRKQDDAVRVYTRRGLDQALPARGDGRAAAEDPLAAARW